MNKESGQTFIEYLLLTLVLVSVIFGIVRSDLFRDIVDYDGELMQGFYKRMRYSYRHALPGNKKVPKVPTYTSPTHDSYFNEETGQSRFFAPNQGYPE